MNYVFFSYDGAIFSVAKKLFDEGNDVIVCQIRYASQLGIETWISVETPEKRNRRLTLYNGLLEKWSLDKTMDYLRWKDRIDKSNTFIIFDHNTQYKIAEKVLKMGYQDGLFPIEYDYLMEKDRKRAKEIVKNNYPGIKLTEVNEFRKVDDVIKFVSESEKLWVIKSDGNFAETLVPDNENIELGKMEVIAKLKEDKKDFEKGNIIAEEKIMKPLEFAAEMVFYNGDPIYSQVEIETRMFGSCDIGPQTGGNENLVVATQHGDKINEICFPSIVYEEASTRKGMYIKDAGLLSDGENLYFTEFAGNRWGWGGIFSELSASKEDGMYSNYFEKIKNGESPYIHQYGTSLALYSLDVDDEFAKLSKGKMPIIIQDEVIDDFFLYQIRQNENKDGLISVGYRLFEDAPLGYVVGRGNTIYEAVESIYKNLEHFSFKGVYYRPKSDFLSIENNTHILRRIEFLKNKRLIS